MLSGAAHEINNPLTGVVGHLDLLLRSPAISPEDRERLRKVQTEARRIAGLVRNLLRVAHRDTGEKSRLDLKGLLQETVALREPDFHRSGLELRLDLRGTPLPILGNGLELQQVFLNIINNALDALQEMPAAGGPARGLTVRTSADGDRAVVTFSDDGP